MSPSSTVNEDIRAFWNERAALKELSGSNDFLLKEFEQAFLLEHCPDNARVLDIGCGNGDSLIKMLTQCGGSGVGLDFAGDMLTLAADNAAAAGLDGCTEFHQHAHPEPLPDLGLFDVVFSQRCIINLLDWESQLATIRHAAAATRPGGILILLESTRDGQDSMNAMRADLGLEPIEAPWHNRFLRVDEVADCAGSDLTLEQFRHISSTYIFLSRVIYARLAADTGEEMKYDSAINKLSLSLPAEFGDTGPVKAWLWRKTA